MLSGGSGGPEIICFFSKNMTFMIKIRTQKSWGKIKNGLKSLSNGPNLMIPGAGSMKTKPESGSTIKHIHLRI